jgi:hypothetical protein
LNERGADLAERLRGAPTKVGVSLALIAGTILLSVAAGRGAMAASVLLAALTAAPLVVGLRRLHFDWTTVLVVLSGAALYLVYWTYTHVGERNYDAPSQLTYIRHLATTATLPPPSLCGVCGHPPLYYAIGAAGYLFFHRAGLIGVGAGLQLLSLGMFLGFVVYSLALVRRLSPHASVVRLAAVLIVFWPYSVLNSVRVHNDALIYPLIAGAAYHLTAWDQERRPRDLHLTAAWCAIGLWVKPTGWAMVAATLGVIGYVLVTRGPLIRVLRAAALVVLLVGGAFALLVWVRSPAGDPSLCERFVTTACHLPPGIRLPNGLGAYFAFDVGNYLAGPYVDVRDAQSVLFWNHFLKSSLLGTAGREVDPETSSAMKQVMARGMTWLLPVMLAYVASGIWRWIRHERTRKYLAIAFASAALFGSLMAFRTVFPIPHHADFRHVFPLLVPLSLAYATAVAALRESPGRLARVVGHLGWGIALSFAAASVVYFSPP